jgi:hypothetical protein
MAPSSSVNQARSAGWRNSNKSNTPSARSAGNCASNLGSASRRTASGVAGSSINCAEAMKMAQASLAVGAGRDRAMEWIFMDIDFLWDRKKDVPEDVPVTAKSTERPRVALN